MALKQRLDEEWYQQVDADIEKMVQLISVRAARTGENVDVVESLVPIAFS